MWLGSFCSWLVLCSDFLCFRTSFSRSPGAPHSEKEPACCAPHLFTTMCTVIFFVSFELCQLLVVCFRVQSEACVQQKLFDLSSKSNSPENKEGSDINGGNSSNHTCTEGKSQWTELEPAVLRRYNKTNTLACLYQTSFYWFYSWLLTLDRDSAKPKQSEASVRANGPFVS